MLIYDPALDPYHCAIRILALAVSSAKIDVELTTDAARIGSYFLAYPSKMLGFVFPAEYRSIRAMARDAQNPYRSASGDKVAFERMRPIFVAAVSGLVAAKLLEPTSLERGIVQLTKTPVPQELVDAVTRFRDRQTRIGNFLLSDFLRLPTNGNSGIKSRSGLIEHRYDPS